MSIRSWIGGPAIVTLSAVEAALELQARAVRGVTRALIREMDRDHWSSNGLEVQ
jgi:hypothetical protein